MVGHERVVWSHAIVRERRLKQLQLVVEIKRLVVVHRVHLAAESIVRVNSIDERQRGEVCLQRDDDFVVAD